MDGRVDEFLHRNETRVDFSIASDLRCVCLLQTAMIIFVYRKPPHILLLSTSAILTEILISVHCHSAHIIDMEFKASYRVTRISFDSHQFSLLPTHLPRITPQSISSIWSSTSSTLQDAVCFASGGTERKGSVQLDRQATCSWTCRFCIIPTSTSTMLLPVQILHFLLFLNLRFSRYGGKSRTLH